MGDFKIGQLIEVKFSNTTHIGVVVDIMIVNIKSYIVHYKIIKNKIKKGMDCPFKVGEIFALSDNDLHNTLEIKILPNNYKAGAILFGEKQ